FKGGQVDFAHGVFVNDGIDVVPVVFFVVAHVVLDGRAHSLRLHPSHIGNSGACGEERVLAEILEVSATHRSAVDVHPRAQQEIHATSAGIGPENCAGTLN